MPKIKTYTPTNFRKHIYQLLNQVKDNRENIQITVQPRGNGANQNVLVINQNQVQQLLKENRIFKQEKMARKIDWYASRISSNPVFKDPAKFEKWCEDNDD